MCRIAGWVSTRSVSDSENNLKQMLGAMAHGGPDDEGIYKEEKICLGHRRLSIIDLSSGGHQPMSVDAGEYVIIFNGEIYNYQELRRRLARLGCVFQTQTDTEVILQAYKYWGANSFNILEGIFAFAIYDKGKQKLILVRDHVGVKPLYYSFRNAELIFASEVRAFKAYDPCWPEDENWKAMFLAFGSMPFPFTTLKDVYVLEPGCSMEIDIHNLTYKNELFDLAPLEPPRELGAQLIREKVTSALKKNLISDAPLGVFLSGGIDSSLLTLLANTYGEKIKTISINFEDAQFDESVYQKRVLEKMKNANHVSHVVTEKMFWDSLPDIWKAMDQPTIDGVNTYFVSKYAHEDGLKAVLSGLGADELFGGYASFKRIRLMRKSRWIPFKKTVSQVLGRKNKAYERFSFLDLGTAAGDYLFLRGIHVAKDIAAILNTTEKSVWEVLEKVNLEQGNNLSEMEYASFLESKFYMTNQLLRDTDVMGMWHALEVRVPFLDIELIRAVNSLPSAVRYKQTAPKALLIDSFKGLLPQEVIYRKKQGFTFPISLWLKNGESNFSKLFSSRNDEIKIFNDFRNGKEHWSKCWSLAVLHQFRTVA